MTVELGCACGASFTLDGVTDEDAFWMLIYRFVNAHVDCGYMTRTFEDSPAVKKVSRKGLSNG